MPKPRFRDWIGAGLAQAFGVDLPEIEKYRCIAATFIVIARGDRDADAWLKRIKQQLRDGEPEDLILMETVATMLRVHQGAKRHRKGEPQCPDSSATSGSAQSSTAAQPSSKEDLEEPPTA